MIEFFSGKKTYIMMFVTGALGIATAFGYVFPDWVWAIDAALFGGALRAGIDKGSSV